MLLIKCPHYHRGNVFSPCPIKNCVITVVIILGVLPFVTAFVLESIQNPSLSPIQMSDHNLNIDTVTESQQLPRLLTVTKGESRSVTTSTVRPWPSHSFFRSVLSNSDNVVGKKRNRSKSSRISNETGISVHKASISHLKGQNDFSVAANTTTERNNLKTKKKHRRHRKRLDSKPRKVDKSLSDGVAPNESQITSNGNNTRARSVAIITRFAENILNNASTIKQRNPSQPLHEDEKQMLESIPTNGVNQQSENVTGLSQPENFILNEMERKANEYSHINSPQVGFQYEIVVPPPPAILPPRPSPSGLTVNTTVNHMPAFSSSAISTTLEHFYYNDSSGSQSDSSSNIASADNAEEDGSENNKNTSNSTIPDVNVNDMGKKVTNDDTTISPPLPLVPSQVEDSENAETATASMVATATLNSSYNKGNKMILQNSQAPSQLSPTTPTQLVQLDVDLVKGNKSGGEGESITYNNKSHLPYSVDAAGAYFENVNEIHTEIKKTDLWTINHNSGNADSANKTFLRETSTFLPFLKGDRKQNSSNINILAGAGIGSYRVTTTTRTNTVFPPFLTNVWKWKTQPTHFSFHPTTPHSLPEEIQMEQTASSFHTEKPNQTFHKRISQYRDHHRQEINSANTNYPAIQSQAHAMNQQTALINRRNMFTVVKSDTVTNPRIRIESRNITRTTVAPVLLNKTVNRTKSRFPGYPSNMLLYDRTNQVERPSITTSILTGPDRTIVSSASPELVEKGNDYFDEDDTQAKLHHWIESEQGHFVTPSTELPRFTNLTWPYNIPNSASHTIRDSLQGNSDNNGVGGGSGSASAISPASTALAVSFNSQRKDKPDFNTQFEFYIPSAAADPKQNPILLAKKQANKTTEAAHESWTRVPTLETFTTTHQPENGKQDSNNLKQSDHKSKIKHSHWGSKGLSSIKPQNSQKINPPSSIHNRTKVYAGGSTSKSTPSSSIPFPTFAKTPGATTLSIFSNKHQKYFFTSPSTPILGSSSTWPFGVDGALGQSETASFVTSKTPTNIWYKPIINHFTASVPFNGNVSLVDSVVSDQIFNNAHGMGGVPFVTTTVQPPSTQLTEYVGGSDYADDDSLSVNTNKKDKTIPTKSRSNATNPEKDNDDSKTRILFKVWNFVDGKMKLQNQREIPGWALQGYLIPASGTILNLQQIPPAIQPLVTSAMAMNTASEYHQSVPNKIAGLSYVWRPLPIRGSLSTLPAITTVVTEETPSSTTTKSTTTRRSVFVPTTPSTSADESLFDSESFPLKIAGNNVEWHTGTDEMHGSNKQPISINYVLWNNPASIYGQSIILSTPNPQALLSHQPTPVSYFPPSTITSGENTPQQQFSEPSVATIKNPGSSSSASYITTTTPRTSSHTDNKDQEKLELLFQNYFQYFITTSTPAPVTTTTTTARPMSLASKVTETYGGQADNQNAWKDLKKLILRLASTKAEQNDSNKASATFDKDKAGDLDFLGNVAAIALMMSYLRNQYEEKESSSSLSTTPAPYGVTDDMTPPNKDQLWATVYPLFQHYMNNPNYTFVPPPPPPQRNPPPHQSTNQQLLSSSTAPSYLASIMTPTSPGLIPFTEQEPITGSSSNYYTQNDEYNHYASYYPPISTPLYSMISHNIVSITEVPKRGATTEHSPRSEEVKGEVDYDLEVETTTQRAKTLLLLKALKKKKKKGKFKKGLLGAALLKKISAPLFHVVKKPSKYWLDLKFEVDFIEILKKKLLFLLAYKYMPVVQILAFGLTPVLLSLVPLLYKMLWSKLKKPKYIKVPVPYPEPYPVYKSPSPPPPYNFGNHHGYNHQSHYTPSEGNHYHHRQEIRYENGHQNDDVSHIDPPTPLLMEHHYAAADTSRNDNGNQLSRKHLKNSYQPERENGGYYGGGGVVNSFNYDYGRHSTPTTTAPTTHAENGFKGYYPADQQHQEVHVHLHDDESRIEPQFLQRTPPGVTHIPEVAGYTSYTKKDLQPYPVTKSYEIGFDIGKTLAGISNKHDMEIFKILVETKKAKLNKLMEMWKLAKYGAAVASDAAVNVIRGPTTPSYADVQPPYKKKRKKRRKRRRRRRRKKRKHSNETSHHNATKALS